jgi:hypothetical protein
MDYKFTTYTTYYRRKSLLREREQDRLADTVRAAHLTAHQSQFTDRTVLQRIKRFTLGIILFLTRGWVAGGAGWQGMRGTAGLQHKSAR